MEHNVLFLLLGVLAGYLSGLIGIGGGIIIVPALVLLFGLSQHLAQGTTLALMIPPIGIFAVMEYYRHGYVDLKIAVLICLGFFLGSFFGARMAIHLPNILLERAFGLLMVVIGIRMFFSH